MNSPSNDLGSSLIILAGPLRSGSTLLRLMLDRHSHLIAAGELDFLFDAMSPDGGLAAAAQLGAKQFDDFLSDHRIYLEGKRRVDANGETIDRVRAYVGKYACAGHTVVINLHRNFVTAHELFPKARFIHLLRDPRDCAKSSVAIGFAENVYHGLHPWLEAEASWDRLAPHLRPADFVETRFEALVVDARAELARICEFLGLPYEAQMLDLSASTYDTPSPRLANQWQASMNARDVELVEARVGNMMQARGYHLVGAGQRRLSRAHLMQLSFHNAVLRRVRKLRTYGLGLWIQDQLSRRLGLRAWSRSVRLKMNAIETSMLK